jgi:hypothetical protein
VKALVELLKMATRARTKELESFMVNSVRFNKECA